MSLVDANQHARSTTHSRFNTAPKVKINRKEYHDILAATYLLAETNGIKDIRCFVKQFIKRIDEYKDHTLEEVLSEIIGETDLHLIKVWDDLRKTTFGRKIFAPMEVEDLIYDRPVQNLFNKPVTGVSTCEETDIGRKNKEESVIRQA